MFHTPRYIQHSFSIIFPQVHNIRRRIIAFEDVLRGEYGQPQIIPIPDEFAPEVPRIIFESEHRYSQIVISQVSIALNVTYSPDYQVDAAKRRQYLAERISYLFALFDMLKDVVPAFSGLTTQVDLSSEHADDMAILKRLTAVFLHNDDVTGLHDLQFKITQVREERFFSNMVIQNYRIWPGDAPDQSVRALRRSDAIERGCRIVGDFNDRYAFNEQVGYHSTHDAANRILDQGLAEIEMMVARIVSEQGEA